MTRWKTAVLAFVVFAISGISLHNGYLLVAAAFAPLLISVVWRIVRMARGGTYFDKPI